MNTEQKARAWLTKPNQLDTRMMIASLENAEKIITELLEQNHLLLQAGKGAMLRGDASTYTSEEDEFGVFACCGEVDYKEHDPTCWTLQMKKAIAMCEEQKQ